MVRCKSDLKYEIQIHSFCASVLLFIVGRLRSLTDQIPSLRKELEAATTNANELKRRLKHDRDQMHAATRVLEQQLDNLDSSRVALRQAANRLRGRSASSTPMKKSSNTAGSSSNAETKSSTNTDPTSVKNQNEPKSKTELQKQSTEELKYSEVSLSAQSIIPVFVSPFNVLL